ncbi:hypothetical protein [Bacillus toyonensis]|uniref:hypothetical protein n=1 Tax=Bacillus toyonensis TaxID=155322 RepID=UPI000BF0A06C|nr:hypothetical protein [Bacillus toyonensis]NKW96660.1 hypothetical protein [Bacillus toyonensis]PEJ00579.1 hypothetical protein CN671_19520 [Bacillus toyonensis]
MSKVAELKELEKVLKKNPVINTASSEELILSPDSVERNYIKHAMTHMSLGDTKDYENRLFRYLLKNKRAFSGLVTGDFGLGKTSFLVYLWRQCNAKGIMAIPPFSWRSLDDLFQGITKWISYKLEKKNIDALAEFHDIADHYTQRSMKKEIDLLVRAGMDKQSAKQHMEQKVREGTFRLDRNIGELLQFLDKVTPFLERNGYEGLMIFTDELQITLSELAPEKVFQYMFELANSTMSRDGKYGVMIGLPLNSFVQMQQVKSDALDRFAQQKMLVDLSKIYTSDFAIDLWEKYTEYFQFKDVAPDIIDEHALKSLGQLTDCTRKDIGNGPRSVISAFNTIINHYESNGEKYTVLNLIEDIMNEEILLGERSKFITKIKGLLQKVENDTDYKQFLYILAAFPQGCKQDVISHYGVFNEKTEQLLTDWLGKEIRQSRIEGYRLAVLDEVQSAPEGFFEQAIRNFIRYYQASDKEYQENAIKSFNNAIIPELLMEKEKLNWNCLFEQQTDDQIEFEKVPGNIFSTELGGTYDKVKDRYPNRHLHIVTQSSISNQIIIAKGVDDPNYSYVGQWIFYLDLIGEKSNAVIKQERSDLSFAFTLNMKEKIEDTLPLLSDLVPMESVDVQLTLNLIYYLTKTADVPPSEKQELEYFLKEIIDATITTLFNQNMKKIRNSELEMRNHGRSILVELFEKMCVERYPTYQTLMVGRIKQKMNHFKTFLENENIPLSIKRGTQPILENYKRLSATEKRDKVASKFNIMTVSPFEQLMQDFPSLLQVESDGHIYAQIHPAEKLCLESIQESTLEIYDNMKPCQAARIHDISDKLKDLGYVVSEIEFIYAFGALRKLFQYEPKNQMFYIKPLTIEEWQITLQEKLTYIGELKDELALVNQDVKIDIEEITKDIGNLSDEDTYEDLSKRVRETGNFLQQKMSLYINQQIDVLEYKLNKSSRVLSALVKSIDEVAVTEESEKQNWYKMRVGLSGQLVSIQTKYTEIFNGKSALSKTAPKDFSMSNNGINYFIEASSKIEELHKGWERLKQDRKKLEADVEKWLGWANYFDMRVELRKLIEQLETLGLSHLILEIDTIDKELDSIWEAETVFSHEEWLTKLINVRAVIHNKIRRSRDQFNAEKQSYQEFINESSMVYKLRTQFNETEQSQSYEQLREEFKEAVENQINKWLNQAEHLEQRLAYLTNILDVDVTTVEDEVFSLGSTLFHVKADLQKNFRLEGLKPLKTIPTNIHQARTKIEGTVQKGKLDKKEEILLNSMKTSSISLEELILDYSEETDSLNLEEVLKLITNLFKKNHINIRIEKGGK